MSYVFPRLDRSVARRRLVDLRKIPRSALSDAVLYRHPEAAPVEVGGRPVDEGKLFQLRADVIADMADVRSPEGLEGRGRFDRTLTMSLQRRLDIVDADTAHEGVWSFLTLMIFPDVAAERWPDMQDARMVGVQRNALRRLWLRGKVLGNLVGAGDRPLGEDELVALFERSALARNRRLVRTVAQVILDWRGTGARSDVVRELAKQMRRLTGPMLLDILSDEELHALVWGVALKVDTGFGARAAAPVPAAASKADFPATATTAPPVKDSPTAAQKATVANKKSTKAKKKLTEASKEPTGTKPPSKSVTADPVEGVVLLGELIDVKKLYARLWADADHLAEGRRLYKGTSTLRPLLDELSGEELTDPEFRKGRDDVREALRQLGWAVAVDRDLTETVATSGRTVRWLLLHARDD